MYTPPHQSPLRWESNADDPGAIPKDAVLIRDPDRIREILGALIRHGAQAELKQGGQRLPIAPHAYSDELDIVQWLLSSPLEEGPIDIDLQGYNCLYRLQIEQWIQHQGKLTSSVPRTLIKVQKRRQRRKRVSGMQLHCTLPSGKVVEQTIRDISYQGLSIYHDDELDGILLAGETVNAELAIRDGDAVQIAAKVVELSTSDEGDICHLAIADTPKRKGGWADVVDDRLHPGTRSGSQYRDDIWKLFVDSGYLDRAGTKVSQLETLRTDFFKVLGQLDAASHLGSQIVWPHPSGQGIQAALSMLKVYQHSWSSFQMARLKNVIEVSDAKVMRELHMRAYEHAQKDADLRWIVAYSEAHESWSSVFHEEIAQKHLRADDVVRVGFRAMRYEVKNLDDRDASDVDRPSGSELHALATKIGRVRSRAYCDALDLVPERLSMQEMRRHFARTNMGRDRVVFVVRESGRARAAAVVEMASDGLHVFGMLDLVRVFSLEKDGSKHYGKLLARCASWYKDKGKRSFCLYLENGQKLAPALADEATDLGHSEMLIMPAAKLPEFFESLYTVTSPEEGKLALSQPAPQ